MDEETKYLLDKWGVSSLIPVFEENMIDVSTLNLLTESDMDKFINPMGTRIRFRENWRIWKQGLFEAQPETQDETTFNLDELPVVFADDEPIEEQVHKQLDENKEQNSFQLALPTDLVLTVLNGSIDGKAILATAKANNLALKESLRKELARLVIRFFLDKDPSQRIPSTLFTRLALQITKIFPKESAALYFTSSLAANRYQKKKNASGLLYEAYISRRRKLRNIGSLPRRTCRSSTSSSSSVATSPVPTSVEAEENPVLEEHLRWLNNSVEPWALVELYWKDTATFRLKLTSEQGNIDEYFNRYPALKQHQGYQLLAADFSVLYPNIENRLFCNVILCKEKILSLATERRRNSRDPEYKRQLDVYLAAASDSPENKNCMVATLLLLPYLMSVPTGIKKPGKPVWKPSRSEVRDGFVTHVPTEADILPVVEARKNKYKELGRTFQPLVMVVGRTLEEADTFHVIVDNTVYDFSSGIKAVDGAFKIFHATGACYPEEAADLWLAIQIGFYEIHTKYDRVSQSIRHLLADLNRPI